MDNKKTITDYIFQQYRNISNSKCTPTNIGLNSKYSPSISNIINHSSYLSLSEKPLNNCNCKKNYKNNGGRMSNIAECCGCSGLGFNFNKKENNVVDMNKYIFLNTSITGGNKVNNTNMYFSTRNSKN